MEPAHLIDVVAVEKRSSAAFVRAMLGCWQAGEIAMPLDPGADLPEGLQVIRTVACDPGGGWLADRAVPRRDDAPAQITLTSGTTGRPKPILLSHRALADVTDRLIAAQRLDESVREYVGVPVTFSFGLGRVRTVAAVGGQSFLPERGFRVDELAAMLRRGEVNALSAVPTLLRLALDQRARLEDVGDRLRWLEIGSQPMSAEDKAAIRTLFPNARIIQHYGLTEASRSTFLDVTDADAAGLETVGSANGAVEVRITDDGLIAIRGAHVADGIVTPAGLEPLTGVDGWLVTRDLGRLDDAGRLTFAGRVDHLINVGGVKVSAELFEEKLLARLGADAPLAVGAGRDPLRGELVAIAYEGEEQPGWREAIAATAAEMGVSDGVVLFPVAEIPRTATAKIRRQEITALYATAAPPARAPADLDIVADGPAAGVAATFVAVFGEAGREESASFQSLGGDSLHYVSMLVGLERFVAMLPDDWDMLSVGALAALAAEQAAVGTPAAQRRALPQSLDSVRGLACVLIVALHVVGVSASEGLKLPVDSPWHTVMESLNLVRLPMFTALSGYLYGAMPVARFGLGPFLGRKVYQLIIPMLFATLVFWGLREIAFGKGGSLLWGYIDGYQHLWFLDALFLIFVAVALLDRLVGPDWRYWAGVLLIVPLVYPWFPDIPVMHVKNAFFLLPFFVFGLLLFRHPRLLDDRRLLALAIVLAVALLALQHVEIGGRGFFERFGWLRWMCGAASTVALLRLFPKLMPLERIAAYSFTIYLWHPAANSVVRTFLGKLHVDQTGILFVLGLAAGVLLPVALHRVMLRFPRLSPPVIGR